MKPIKLVMNAFGPYKNKQVIDFTKFFDNNIFLISGKTGSGKSMIFDAICFALYSKSNTDRRKVEYLKSDYCDLKEICYVEYTFSINENIYTIYRAPTQTVDNNKKINILQSNSKLTLPDGEIITKSSEIDKILKEDILKLSLKQFRKIVMLPQGQFQDFLLSNSSSKQEILSNIFDVYKYDIFIDLLKEERDIIQNKIEKILLEIKLYLNNLSHLKNYIDINFDDVHISLASIEKIKTYINCDYEKKEKLIKEIEIIHNDLSKVNLEIDEIKHHNLNVKLYNDLIEKRKDLYNKNDEIKKKINLINTHDNYIDIYNKKLNLDNIILEKDKILEKIKTKEYDFNVIKDKIDNIKNNLNFCEINEKIIKIKKIIDINEKIDILNLEKYNILNDIQNLHLVELSLKLNPGEECPLCGSTFHNKKNYKQENKNTDEMYFKIKDIEKNISIYKQDLEKTKNTFIINKSLNEDLFEYENYISEILKISKLKNNYNIKILKNDLLEFENEYKCIEKEILLLNEKFKTLNNEIYDINKKLTNKNIDLKKLENLVLKEDIYDIYNKEIGLYNNTVLEIDSKIDVLNKTIKTKEFKDMDSLKSFKLHLDKNLKEKQYDLESILKKLEISKTSINQLENKKNEFDKLNKYYNDIDYIFKLSNGNLYNKISFSRFILSVYFEKILEYANIRLSKLTNRRYNILLKEENKGNGYKGLDVDIFDCYTGKIRDVNTLSGGEIFITSLSLALSLSDIIKNNAGSIDISSIFIDEGFTTLDEDFFDDIIEVFNSLSENNILVGIISHSEFLKNRIDDKINIISTNNGSYIL